MFDFFQILSNPSISNLKLSHLVTIFRQFRRINTFFSLQKLPEVLFKDFLRLLLYFDVWRVQLNLQAIQTVLRLEFLS